MDSMSDRGGVAGPQIPTQSGNIVTGVLFGAVAALICAVIWALIGYSTGYEIGWIAVGVGFVVGLTVRIFGHGNTPVFGVVAAALALSGCVLGRLITIWMYASDEWGVSISEAIRAVPVMEALQAMFGVIDLVFIVIALAAGYQTAISQGD